MQEGDSPAAVTVHPSASSVVRFGDYFFDRDNHILSSHGEEIALPPRVLLVLDLLLERAGSVVSKKALLDGVWKDAYVSETSLTEAVSLLRNALGDDAQNSSYIQTVHRRGYRFLAPVVVVGRADAARNAEVGQSPRRPGSFFGAQRALLWLAASSVVLVGIAALVGLVWHRPDAELPVTTALRLDVSSPQGVVLPFFSTSCLALSPDGDVLVFVGRDARGESRLYRRHISDFESHAIAGTEGAGSPFFSPDGRWIGFFANGDLRKAPLNGGVMMRICRASYSCGGSWAEDGRIVFTGSYPGGLSIVSAEGSEVEPLTTCRAAAGEVGHWWPQVLPCGRAVLFTIWSTSLETARVAVLDLESGEERVLIEGASDARFSPPGAIVCLTPGGMTSVPFDLASLQVVGPAQEMRDQAESKPFVGLAHFAVAGNNGTLAYLPASRLPGQFDLVQLGSTGEQRSLGLEPRVYRNLRVDRRGGAVAVTILDGPRSDVWTTKLARPGLNRLTFSGFNIEPRWSPDGEWIVFASNRDGPFNIYRKPANGGGRAERLAVSDLHQYPQAFTPDGKSLLYSQPDPETGFDIWIMALEDGARKTTPFIKTPANEYMPSLSPDGRWVAYLCDEAGGWEVYVRSFDADGGLWQVSRGGASAPFWSADGRQLYFKQRDRIVSVTVMTGPDFSFGETSTLTGRDDLAMIDSLPPGGGFIAIRDRQGLPRVDAVRIVVNPRGGGQGS